MLSTHEHGSFCCTCLLLSAASSFLLLIIGILLFHIGLFYPLSLLLSFTSFIIIYSALNTGTESRSFHCSHFYFFFIFQHPMWFHFFFIDLLCLLSTTMPNPTCLTLFSRDCNTTILILEKLQAGDMNSRTSWLNLWFQETGR